MANLLLPVEAEGTLVVVAHGNFLFFLPQQIYGVLTCESKSLSSFLESCETSNNVPNVHITGFAGTYVNNTCPSSTSHIQTTIPVEVMEKEGYHVYRVPNRKFLKWLSFCNETNSLQVATDMFIHGFDNLKCLLVVDKALSVLPSSIASLVKLRELVLCRNNISMLPDEIGSLVTLQRLDISSNTLQSLPSSMAHLKNLVYLDLSSNSLSDLPNFMNFSKLLFLNLSHNAFQSVPDCLINDLPFVSYLDLSCNKIMFFDTPPRCVGRLTKLNISNNWLNDIPKWLFSEKCKLLKELIMSDNRNMIGMSEISVYSRSGDLQGVSSSLKILHASNCCFSASSVEFLYGLKALETLTLGNVTNSKNTEKHLGNIIFTFPFKSLKTCTNLKYLNLSNVGLTELPNDISNFLPKLETLCMNFGHLEHLPESFCKLVSLKRLELSCNELRSLPADFGLLNTLEDVRLNGNKLQCLPNSFKQLKSLKILDLYDNILVGLPTVLLKLPNLESCDVELNFFSSDSLPEQGFCTFMEMYPGLKRKFRSFISEVDPNVASREDGKKQDSQESEDGDMEPPYIYEEHEISSCESENNEVCGQTEECINMNDDSHENWDVSDDSDSHFDPNFQRTKKPASYGPSLLVYDAVSTSPDQFCPADIHSDPIRRARRYERKTVVEGQFDDAEN